MKILYDEFLAVICSNIPPGKRVDRVLPEDLLSDLGLDSLGFATLLWSLEDRFNLQVDDRYLERLNDLSTVSELIAVFAELGHEIECVPEK